MVRLGFSGNHEQYTEHFVREGNTIHVNKGQWHQIINDGTATCTIIEIQYGDQTVEDDIERLDIETKVVAQYRAERFQAVVHRTF